MSARANSSRDVCAVVCLLVSWFVLTLWLGAQGEWTGAVCFGAATVWLGCVCARCLS